MVAHSVNSGGFLWLEHRLGVRVAVSMGGRGGSVCRWDTECLKVGDLLAVVVRERRGRLLMDSTFRLR